MEGLNRAGKWRQRLASRSVASGAWVGLCFALASAVYLSWLNRLVALTQARAADWLSMVAAYLFQAAGMGAACWRIRRRPEPEGFAREAAAAATLFAMLSVPAILAHSPLSAALFGFLMNLAYGVIAGQYMYAVAVGADAGRRGLVFGGGYAAATVAVGLLTLVGNGALVQGSAALLVYLPLAAAAVWAALRLPLFAPPAAAPAPQGTPAPGRRDLALTCAMVALISAVKNLGFSFPSADIATGLSPQLSRLPYAAGLLSAGVILDRNRKSGMVCTLTALMLPFIMLGLAGEPVPRAVCWGLDYLFFGFFSVFRATLFADIAARTKRWALAPLGLLAGRLGDVAGTAVALALDGRRVALVAATAALFVPAVFLLLRQFQRLYEPEVVRQRSEQETFEAFCLRSDLSQREREVLRMILANHSNAGIAEALFISESTVKYHVRNVLQKTGCKNRGELQRKYTLALYPRLEEA